MTYLAATASSPCSGVFLQSLGWPGGSGSPDGEKRAAWAATAAAAAACCPASPGNKCIGGICVGG